MARKKIRFYSLKLPLLMIGIFILQVLSENFTKQLVLISSDIATRPWILLTSIFLHSSLQHLLYNLFALALFGILLESLIGSRNFLIVFFLTGLTASFAVLFFYNAALGASGAIFGIIGTLTALRPGMMIFAFGVPMPMLLAAILWAIMDFAGIGQQTGTAHIAHLTGLAAGLLLGLIFRKRQKRGKGKRL